MHACTVVDIVYLKITFKNEFETKVLTQGT